MITIIDTDTLLALLNHESMYHFGAKSIAEQLVRVGIDSVVLPTTLHEVAVLVAPRIGERHARESILHLISAGMTVTELSQNMIAAALKRYREDKRDDIRLGECYVMAAAEELSAECIFSFNPLYPLCGFQLAEGFVREFAQLKEL